MNARKLTVIALVALFGMISSTPVRAGIFVDCIDAGYDLYQLGDFRGIDVLAESAAVPGIPGGDFLGVQVEGFPLQQFDFGSGLVSVGTADTIVRRTQPVFSDDPSSVPIEIVALSLKSVAPVDLGPSLGGINDIYVTLSPTQPVDQGSYNAIEFFGGNPAGAYQTQFVFDYEIHAGAPNGPVIPSGPFAPGSLDLLSDFSAAWSHQPQPIGFFGGPDRVLPGINSLLNGVNQSADFFLDSNNALVMSDFFGANNTHLTFTMADAVPGEQPDAPVFPDGVGDGGEFLFQNVDGGGNWFDPPLTDSYYFETTDGLSNFVTVGLPPSTLVPDADMSFEIVSSDGTVSVASGGFHTFGSPVDSFTIQGIGPLVDGGDPLAFPVFLLFDQSTVSFTMAPVPEPSTLALLLLGVAAMGKSKSRLI